MPVDVNAEIRMPVDNHEAEMARADLYKMAKYSMKLFQMIQEGQELEGWVQSKITKASDYISSIYHYMEYQMKFGSGMPAENIEDITSEAEVEREEIAVEDDENMEESMNYEQKLKALLEGAMKKEMKKKPAKKEAKTDEALDTNLIKAAQKGQEGKPIGKPDAESDKNVKKKYGYRSDGEPADKEDDVGKQDRPGRKRKTKESLVKTVVKRVVEANKKGSKPDFLDMDKDGDKKEPMKKAAKEAGKGDKKETKGVTAAQKKLPPGLQKAIAKKKGASESVTTVKKVVAESTELNRIKMLSGL